MTATATPIRGLVTLWPVFAAAAVLTFGEGTFLILISPYLESRGIDLGLIGVLVAVYGIASLVTRFGAGAAYTARRGPLLVAGAALLSAVAFLFIPTTGEPVLIAGLVGLNGAAFAFGTAALMAAVMERRSQDVPAGTLMGIYTGSLAVGYALAGFVGGPVADVAGIAGAFRLGATVAVIAGAVLFASLRHTAVTRSSPRKSRVGLGERLRAFGGVPRWVWLGFIATLYINLVSGVLLTFFPLHALDIGLSLSAIGIVIGIHGVAAATSRFVAAPVFARVSYRAAMLPAVALSAVGIALLGSTSTIVVIALAWAAIGLARGVLRVSSAALVLDESADSEHGRGAASSVYLSGLDVGKVVGPVLGAVGAVTIGIAATFLVAAVLLPLVYIGAALWSVGRHGVLATEPLV